MGSVIICRTCGEPFATYPKKPGYIDECPSCYEERGATEDLTVADDGGEEWQPTSGKLARQYSRHQTSIPIDRSKTQNE